MDAEKPGLQIECSACGSVLTEQGWLLFGPPNPSGLAMKYHICRRCVVLPQRYAVPHDQQ